MEAKPRRRGRSLLGRGCQETKKQKQSNVIIAVPHDRHDVDLRCPQGHHCFTRGEAVASHAAVVPSESEQCHGDDHGQAGPRSSLSLGSEVAHPGAAGDCAKPIAQIVQLIHYWWMV